MMVEGKAPKAEKGKAKAPTAEKKEVKSSCSGGGNRWLHFVQSYREQNSAKFGNLRSKILKEAGCLWKDMSESEKNKYGTVAAK